MGATNQIDLILVTEILGNLTREDKAYASVIVLPICRVFIRVGPEQITEESGIGHVGRSHYIVDCEDAV